MYNSLSNPPSFLHLTCLLLSTLLLRSALCQNVICYGGAHRPLPRPADCRHILPHMPRVPSREDSEAVVGSASPFFPNALFVHGTCIIVVEIRSSGWPRLDGLPETTALHVWNSMIGDAANTIAQCVDNGQMGVIANFLDTSDLTYSVVVERTEGYPALAGDQRRAMDEDHPQFKDYRHGLFRWTNYLV